jgi:DNA-binding NtrC family response regulator
VRGAFTGATSARQGLLELANGATVFFDEAGDIPLSVQVKLLRVLEQQEVTPVGDTRSRRTSFRVVAATNHDLRRECAEGRFRQDLFFRLAVFEIQLPPLRERREEIPQLAERFLRRSALVDQAPPHLLDETVTELCRREWPGNVRELRNAVEHGALMARGRAIAPEHLPPPTFLDQSYGGSPTALLRAAAAGWAQEQLASSRPQDDLYQRFLDATEPELFHAVISSTGGNRAQAAALLGMHRATLRKKLSGESEID